MDNSTKELEDICRLMDLAEEGISQVSNLLAALVDQKGTSQKRLLELQDRASKLHAQLSILEAERQIITSRYGSHI
jgi:septation ring formation regulator EzrA